MVEPEYDDLHDVRTGVCGDQLFHGRVYIFPVGIDLVHGGSAKVTPVRSDHPGTDGLVITVEDIVIVRVAGIIAGIVRDEQKSFPEPGRMTEMPFGRTYVDNGLYHIILLLQRPANLFAGLPDGAVSIE